MNQFSKQTNKFVTNKLQTNAFNKKINQRCQHKNKQAKFTLTTVNN